eukprot:CAMPEP_0116152008 /NCGR_PEP_ID=MMETSP0329-20121206/20414_1 /TAXON_ID=697910 /ORGANISM="Pseudo-nitzschia arenysensis, Strain B593" /LENGTH=39 /DNA_ID= /DNA_START= /DNA_END= /DNA_ORIENTATION=
MTHRKRKQACLVCLRADGKKKEIYESLNHVRIMSSVGNA